MELNQQQTEKERSIKQLRLQLASLTKELTKTTEQIQLLEIHEINLDQIDDNRTHPEEIGELIKKQNKISHEMITIKRKYKNLVQKLS